MSGRSRSYKDGLYRRLQDNAEAVLYIQAALEDSQESFLAALKNVLEARNLSEMARKCELDRANIYRMLGAQGNPTLASLDKILHSLGLRLAVALEEPSSEEVMAASEPRHVFVTHGTVWGQGHSLYQSVSYRKDFSYNNEAIRLVQRGSHNAVSSSYEAECETPELAMAS